MGLHILPIQLIALGYHKKAIGVGNLEDITLQTVYSMIQMNRLYVRGKQNPGAELNTMLLNISDQLKMKCDLKLWPCGDIKAIGCNKEPID